jgi:phosphatidylglycerol:prolipoprotein diacylglycerol transferase
MCAVFAVIPYTTFPTIELGPLNLRTFGLCVALGVLLGAWLAASYAERYGIERDETYRVATWMVLAGIIGSRLTWAATHTDQIDSPIDVIAIWEGGIQFSGGFIAALIVGLPFFRRWSRLQRWHVLDGYAFGLSLGLAFGRIGCFSVGEHFGRTTDFFLATRYDGGDVREPFLGDVPLAVGDTFHNTALYEFLYLMIMFGIMGALVLRARRRKQDLKTGTLVGFFVLVYGVCRFLSDSLRVNDERVAGLTGAQWMSLAMIPAGAYILVKVRPKLAALPAVPVPAVDGEAEPDADVDATEPDADGDVDATEAEASAGDAKEVAAKDDADADAGDEAGAGDGEADEGAEVVAGAADAESDDAGADEQPAEAAVPTEAEVTADEEAAAPDGAADADDTPDTDDDVPDTGADDDVTGSADDAAVEESPHPAK